MAGSARNTVFHSRRPGLCPRWFCRSCRSDRFQPAWLFVAFTVREAHIRVISARDMNQKEAKKYGARR
ncbi:MAG: BrnT family toxin [Phycisphaerales bacterium]|nr:BrnT family toxin [Phycisphaerales bacterium]